MPIEIARELAEGYVKEKKYTPEQQNFILRIAALVYKTFPDLDERSPRLYILPAEIEFDNEYGIRAFYLSKKDEGAAYYYQYQRGRENDYYEEGPKQFVLFTDKEIIAHIKRKRFPYTKDSAAG
jgi:hypothetical protein